MSQQTFYSIEEQNEVCDLCCDFRPPFYWLNEDSRKFLASGYLLEGETPEQRIRDIANHAESLLKIEGFADKFYDYMSRGFFSLSSPVWANYGRKRGLPVSCFNSYMSDNTASILFAHAEVGMMSKFGGGCSGYLGNIRGRGSDISDGGKTFGAVHFLELFQSCTSVISQGSVRRGHFSPYLEIDHPDAEEFIAIGDDGHPIQHLNPGVIISDEFMKRLLDRDPEAMRLQAKLIDSRNRKGFPYIFFTDNVNTNKPDVYLDKGMKIHGSNMCCVTGDQRVVTDKGLLRVKDLYESGEELVVFDDEKPVKASPMQWVRNDVVYRITTKKGMQHTITAEHKVSTTEGIKRADELKIGDSLNLQSNKGLFGDVSKVDEALLLGLYQDSTLPEWIWECDQSTQTELLKGYLNVDDDSRLPEACSNFITESHSDWHTLIQNLGLGESTSEIVAIEELPAEDVYCLEVYSDDHLWTCNGFITHNSEIGLPSSDDESFVCVLSSINLERWDEIKETDAIETMIFFLDTVVTEAQRKLEAFRDSNEKEHQLAFQFMERAYRFMTNHRALGLGVLGWHSLLQRKLLPFESRDAAKLNLEIAKTMKERSYNASEELANLFGEPELLKGYGRRNATTGAIAPTKSSSFCLGQVSSGIEPYQSNYFVKDLAKGKTVFKNPCLEKLLIQKGQNTTEVWDSILKHDGSVQHLEFLSDQERATFKTFFEIDPKVLLDQAAVRQAYIDQAQSLNLAIDPKMTAKEINELYIYAWQMGIKTLYYQYSLNAAQSLTRQKLRDSMGDGCVACEG